MDNIKGKASQTVYRWRYDDGTYGVSVIQDHPGGKEQCLLAAVFKNKAYLRTEMEKIKKGRGADGFDEEKLKIKCGLAHLSKRKQVSKEEERGKHG